MQDIPAILMLFTTYISGRMPEYQMTNSTKRLSRSTGPLRLVYAGRVHHDKGVLRLDEALAIAAHDGVDFTATWFGAGPELDAARERIKQLGLASKIVFPGPLDLPKVMRELRTFDAFSFVTKLRNHRVV